MDDIDRFFAKTKEICEILNSTGTVSNLPKQLEDRYISFKNEKK